VIRRLLRTGLLGLLLVVGVAGPAAAHTKSETHSTWRIVASTVPRPRT